MWTVYLVCEFCVYEFVGVNCMYCGCENVCTLGLLCIFHPNWDFVNGIISRNQQYEQIEKKKMLLLQTHNHHETQQRCVHIHSSK